MISIGTTGRGVTHRFGWATAGPRRAPRARVYGREREKRHLGDQGVLARHVACGVHGMSGDPTDATLVNQPSDVSRLQAGQRGRNPVELLTTWTLVTPCGQLTPRNLELARRLREARPEILAALNES